MTTRYRVAIIGCGRIASTLDDPWFDQHERDESWRVRPVTWAGQLSRHPHTELVAGADPDPVRREGFARRWPGTRVYETYDRMLFEERPDIVVIATRVPDHAWACLAAVQAGARAIACEKPIASSLAEADRMVRDCRAADIPLLVNHTLRYHPEVRAARERILAGEIGRLVSMVCCFDRWLFHMGSHFLDLMNWIAGRPESVMARLDGPEDRDTEGSGILFYPNGVRALVDARPKRAPAYLQIMGTEGIIKMGNDADFRVTLFRSAEAPAPDIPYIQMPPLVETSVAVPDAAWEIAPRGGRYVTSDTIDDLLGALEGKPLRSPGEDALWALEAGMAFYASHSQAGRLVSLPLPEPERALSVGEAQPTWLKK